MLTPRSSTFWPGICPWTGTSWGRATIAPHPRARSTTSPRRVVAARSSSTPRERTNSLEFTASAADQEGLVFVHAHEGSWEAASIAGVTRRLLLEGRVPGTRTALIRMEPGVRLPRHQLHAPERFYILEGEAHVTGQVLGPGDYYCAAAGTVHEDTYAEAGCVLLLIASPIEVFT